MGGVCSCRRRETGMSTTGMYKCKGNVMRYVGGQDADSRRRRTPSHIDAHLVAPREKACPSGHAPITDLYDCKGGVSISRTASAHINAPSEQHAQCNSDALPIRGCFQ